MNIQFLKDAIAKSANISLPTLMLSRQLDLANENAPTPWLSHWDNESRIRITMHEDVAKLIKDNPTYDGLSFKKEEVAEHEVSGVGTVKAYTRFVVINPTSVEMTL